MTIEETRTFEFCVATLERKSQFLGFDADWVINRQQKQATGIVDVLAAGIELELMQIPAGRFLMRSPKHEEEHFSNPNWESPQHTVAISPFCMGKYPVTQAQWQTVASFAQVKCDLNPAPSTFKGDSLPVEGVTWYDAVEFCERLTQHTQRSYRLPSEAEWEYACRARTTTPFHFGERLTPELANYKTKLTFFGGGSGFQGNYIHGTRLDGEDRESTTPVGSFGVANAFGLYDMHGNVWEWCLDDWHAGYEGAPTDGSAWFDSDTTNPSRKPYRAMQRNGSWFVYPVDCPSAYQPLYPNPGEEEWWDRAVLRGGSWFDHPAYCRSGYRLLDDLTDRVVCRPDIGFRVVLSL